MDSEHSESSDSEHSATSEDEDMGQSMEHADSNPPTRSNSTNDLQHTTPYDDTASEAISVDSVATDHPGIVVHAFPAHYNSFEVLDDADDEIDATPAPYIVTVDGNPNLYATHARSNEDLQCYNAFNTDVESMTVGELTDYLEHYANSFQSEDDPSIALAMIQANPGHLAPILDVQTPTNIEVLVHKAPGHALQRFIQSHSYLDRIIDAMQEQANATLPQPLQSVLAKTTRRLTTTQRRSMEAPLTANEFYFAITKSARNKAPGPDGLPIEYYLTDPHNWARVFEVCYSNQLHRGPGERLEPGNHRPLTLLNSDAKLGPKIMSYRLGKTLPTILHEDQNGFVPGRPIQQALFEFTSIQQYCKLNDVTSAGAVLLDFAKAFDSVLWEVLDEVLRHFNFGPTFRAWIKTFYNNTLIYILINGKPLDPFELGAGVRQGDPLSPGLFVLFIEPMLNYIRFHLPGITIDRTKHATIAFADDCTGILADLNDTPRFLDLVEDFCKATGMRLNRRKTQVLPFIPWRDQALPSRLASLGINITPNSGHCKLLGVFFGPNVSHDRRLDHLLPLVHQRCLLWRHRARTIHGRVVLLRTMILPLIWYTTTVTCTPLDSLNRFSPLLLDFLNKKTTVELPDRAAKGILAKEWYTVPRTKGGLGLPTLSATTRSLQLNLFFGAGGKGPVQMDLAAINAKRDAWFATHDPPFISRPSDAELDIAIDALMAANLTGDPSDLRSRALLRCPTKSAENHTMWIPAMKLSLTLPLASILQSLGSSSMPAIWTNNSDQLRNFTVVRGQGIRFDCIDASTCAKLSNLQLTICDEVHKVSSFSRHGTKYFVEISRLDPDVSDEMIFDHFFAMGCQPLDVRPAVNVGSMTSRNRVVHFNYAKIPPMLLDTAGKSVREVWFGQEELLAILNHRDRKYNKHLPPSIAARQTKPTAPATAKPNRKTNPSVPDGPMECLPFSVGMQDLAPSFTAGANSSPLVCTRPQPSDPPHEWYTKIKAQCIPGFVAPAPADSHIYIEPKTAFEDPVNGVQSWSISLFNRFEALTSGEEGAIPQDIDIRILPVMEDSPRPLSACLPMPEWYSTLQSCLSHSYKQYDDSLLHSIAAQPSFYRPWLANKNHALLERYVDAHALQRFAITHDPSDTIWSQKRLLIADAAMETWHQDEPPTDGELLAYLISRAVDMADIARELDLARRLQPV
ncbi:hypothetical protein B5M09_010620 [Aphanomyces astaci]|uniref:Reverse transcriptase domain-containing protein n=1 Tax=Aphanomyces astaci TaxID=112090 RepID=A0A425DIW6_APHAT|nr:hypothetical protein B5M09_010620 [Aphanomyces astaci]